MSFRVAESDEYLDKLVAFTPQQETERRELTKWSSFTNAEHANNYKEWKKTAELWQQHRTDKVHTLTVTHQSVREKNYNFTPPQVTARRLWDNERELGRLRSLMQDNRRKHRGNYAIDNKERFFRDFDNQVFRPSNRCEHFKQTPHDDKGLDKQVGACSKQWNGMLRHEYELRDRTTPIKSILKAFMDSAGWTLLETENVE